MREKLNNISVFTGRFPPHYGGGAKQIEAVLQAITELNPELRICVYVISPLKTQFRKDYGTNIKVKLIYLRSKGYFRYIKLLVKSFIPVVKSSTIMFGLTDYRSLLLALMARIMGKKSLLRTSLVGYDDADSILSQFKYKTGKLFISLMDTVICNSRIIEQSYKDNGCNTKTIYIPNGVNSSFYKPVDINTKKELRKKYSIPEERFLLVYSGSISSRKNIHFLIKVLIELKKISKRYAMFLVGPIDSNRYIAFDNQYWQWIKELINDSRLEEDVFFFSYEGQDASIYQLSDIYVSASLAEGMPNSMLEAMACGLPVVALDIDGNLSRIIGEGENGYLVKTEDAEFFAEFIHKINSNPSLKEKFALKSRKKIESDYTIRKTAKNYLQLISNQASF